MIEIRRKPPDDLILIFEYNAETVKKVKTISGRKWDAKNKYWVVPYNTEAVSRINALFDRSMLVDNTGLDLFNEQANKPKPWEQQTLERLGEALRLKGYSSKTIKAYMGHIRRFISFNEKNPLELDKADIDKYLLFLLDDHDCSHSYTSQAISAVKFLYVEVYGNNELCINISRPKKEKKLPEILSKNEVARILEAVSNIKHKAIICLIYSSGLRVGEAVRLRITDIDSSRMLVHIVQSKGRKDRYTMLSETALKILREYVKEYRPGHWIFPGQSANKHLTERTVQKVFDTARRSAGIKKDVTVHSLRHSFATHLLESGVDLRYIQELLGHESSKTTEIYTRVTEKSISKIVSPLDSIMMKW